MARATRVDLIDAAYHLFLERGFHAVGIDQVIAAVGVTKTTFYNHFESKDELVSAVLRWRAQEWPVRLPTVLHAHAGDNPRDQLRAFFEVRNLIWATHARTGGLFMRAASEYPARHGPVYAAIRAHMDTVKRTLAELARSAGVREPVRLARELMLLVGGSYSMNLLGEAETASDTSEQVAAALVRQHLATARKPGARKSKFGSRATAKKKARGPR